MVLPAFNANSLRVRLLKLDFAQQLAFGAVCCERLLPNYIAFQSETGWGDVAPIRKALDLVWSSLESKSLDTQAVKNITESCESVAPDSENFESLYVSSAQDSCFAVCGLLDYLLENDVDKIVQAATYATDSVDLYVQEIENMVPNDPDLEIRILNHELMQQELKRQREDLEFLSLLNEDIAVAMTVVKEKWFGKEDSCLDLM